jgi:hypothetical protein
LSFKEVISGIPAVSVRRAHRHRAKPDGKPPNATKRQ